MKHSNKEILTTILESNIGLLKYVDDDIKALDEEGFTQKQVLAVTDKIYRNITNKIKELEKEEPIVKDDKPEIIV